MNLADIRRSTMGSLRPPPRVPLSTWIEDHLVLPEGSSALPGGVRLYPYQKAIADSIGDPAVERVTIQKSARIGYTMTLVGALGAFVHNDPSPVLVLMPTESDARDFIVSDVEPVFDASPTLRGVLSAEHSVEKRNTLLHRRYPGGSLKVVAAKAPRNLRRHTVKVLLIDEADAMEPGAEGSPIALAERRTFSFADRKIIMGSTPVFEAGSNIVHAYQQSDMRVFEVPCTACSAFTEILWEHIEWRPDEPHSAAFRCPHCHDLIPERQKSEMVANGVWRATAPRIEAHHGYRINALVSPLANAAWGKLATEFLSVKDRPERLMGFVNTVLGQPWREDGEALETLALEKKAEPFGLNAIPSDVLAITAGVDVQHDRVEITFLGRDRDDVIYVLGHDVIWGNALDDVTWAEVDETLRTRWTHPLGGMIGIDAAVIDSGDGATVDVVYAFCGARSGRRIMAGKGASGARPAIQMTRSKSRGARLWIVGVDGLKAQLFNRLQSGISVRFSEDLPPHWYEQLTSERRVVRYYRGQPNVRFERKTGMAAEALDCVIYAMAASALHSVNWSAREAKLRGLPKPTPPEVIRSSWMHRQ